MSKALKDFKKLMLSEGQVTKLWQNHIPGSRITPTKSGDNDKTWQLRLDAGEVKDSKKRIYLQINSKATNQKLKAWAKKNSTHENLAYADNDVNEPAEKQDDAFEAFCEGIERQAKDNLK